MRVMLANMLPWAEFRRTYGQPIATRELVKRRIARLAALIAGADALVAWGSWLIDQGYRGELECIIAKIFGSEAQKEAAIELFMKTHGGRSFLHGHLFGDNVHDFLAPCIYEGEGEMLGMAFFKSLVKEHGKAVLRADRQGAAAAPDEDVQPGQPACTCGSCAASCGRYAQVVAGPEVHAAATGRRSPGMDRAAGRARRLRPGRVRQRHASELSAAMRKHQLKLADRQCRMAELSQRVQDTVVDAGDGAVGAPAEERGRDRGGRHPVPGPAPQADRASGRATATSATSSELADMILAGGFEELAGVPRAGDPDEVRSVARRAEPRKGPDDRVPCSTQPLRASARPRNHRPRTLIMQSATASSFQITGPALRPSGDDSKSISYMPVMRYVSDSVNVNHLSRAIEWLNDSPALSVRYEPMPPKLSGSPTSGTARP